MDLNTALSQLARDDLSLAQVLEAGRVVARELVGLSVLAAGRVWDPRRLRTQAEYVEFALALASEARSRRGRPTTARPGAGPGRRSRVGSRGRPHPHPTRWPR